MADTGGNPRVALVTGAGARLGRDIADALGADGWRIGVHYHTSEAGAEATAEQIRATGGAAAIIQADLASPDSRADLVARAAEALGAPVTLLINSASVFEYDTAASYTNDAWRTHFEVNAHAPIDLARQLAAALPDDSRGQIINLIDQRVWKLNPQFFTYTLSKSTLWTATRTLAQALAPKIRVNAVGPGPTLRSIHQSEAEFAAEAAATLTGEGSSPQEIVRAIRYLIDAASVTGQMIASDGGQHLIWQTPHLDI